MKLGFSADPAGFDPARGPSGMSHVVIEQVYSTLMSLDPDAVPYPDLAEKFEQSADGLEYTFHLRQGVKFHDGVRPHRRGREIHLRPLACQGFGLFLWRRRSRRSAKWWSSIRIRSSSSCRSRPGRSSSTWHSRAHRSCRRSLSNRATTSMPSRSAAGRSNSSPTSRARW